MQRNHLLFTPLFGTTYVTEAMVNSYILYSIYRIVCTRCFRPTGTIVSMAIIPPFTVYLVSKPYPFIQLLYFSMSSSHLPLSCPLNNKHSSLVFFSSKQTQHGFGLDSCGLVSSDISDIGSFVELQIAQLVLLITKTFWLVRHSCIPDPIHWSFHHNHMKTS